MPGRSAAAAPSAGESLVHEERLGLAVVHDVGDLRGGEVPVDRREVPAGLQRGQVELNRRDAVRQQRRRCRRRAAGRSARSPWTSWLARASRSPARCSVPSASITAIQSGLSCARRQNPSDPTAHLPDPAGVQAMSRGLGRRTYRLVVLVLILLTVLPHHRERDSHDQQDDAEEHGHDRADRLNPRDLRVRGARLVDGAGDALRGSRERALEQHQPDGARGLLQGEGLVLVNVQHRAGDRVDPVGVGLGDVLGQRDGRLIAQADQRAGQRLRGELPVDHVLHELVGGQAVDGRGPGVPERLRLENGGVEHLVGLLLGADRPDVALAGLDGPWCCC